MAKEVWKGHRGCNCAPEQNCVYYDLGEADAIEQVVYRAMCLLCEEPTVTVRDWRDGEKISEVEVPVDPAKTHDLNLQLLLRAMERLNCIRNILPKRDGPTPGPLFGGQKLKLPIENIGDLRMISVEDGRISLNDTVLPVEDVKIESGVLVLGGRQRLDLANVELDLSWAGRDTEKKE